MLARIPLTKANHVFKAVGEDETRAQTWEILPIEGHHCNSYCINTYKWKAICHGQQWSPLESRPVYCFVLLANFVLFTLRIFLCSTMNMHYFCNKNKAKINEQNKYYCLTLSFPRSRTEDKDPYAKWFGIPPQENQPQGAEKCRLGQAKELSNNVISAEEHSQPETTRSSAGWKCHGAVSPWSKGSGFGTPFQCVSSCGCPLAGRHNLLGIS